ncbi:44634_t:CDS:1 [Gigaspora margarita]|uniref:44634_t:CDS:1 n=1 Tax=Gigaspora margarita TaxID=4874 RepID=A0ABN7WFY9_GIGMA|nr:44634_t:CDS:1 [Gigaspora margarita]
MSESNEIQKSFYENSFNNELFSGSPYKLTLSVEELISHPSNTRVAKRHRKNPQFASPPRPLNRFFLFRRDFIAKQKRNGRKMKLADISCLAKNVWEDLPKEAVRCFEVLEQLAKDRHKEIYKGFKYNPKKNNVKNSNSKKPKNTRRNNEKNSNSKNTRQNNETNSKPKNTRKKIERSPENHEKIIEVALEGLEKTSETSLIDVTEYNILEQTKFGLQSSECPLFSYPSIEDSTINNETEIYQTLDSINSLPLPYSECSTIYNVESPIYYYTDLLSSYPLYFESSEINNVEQPTFDSTVFLPSFLLNSECYEINNAELFDSTDFLPSSLLNFEYSVINNVERFDSIDFFPLSPLFSGINDVEQ